MNTEHSSAHKTRNVPRTFGELMAARSWRHDGRCSFCKEYRQDTVKYSTRHYICEGCCTARADVVMPAVKKQERFDSELAAIRAKYSSGEKA